MMREQATRHSITEQTRQELISVAHALADAARPVTLQHFRSPQLNIEDKAADNSHALFDPVTVADRASEKAMRQILADQRPDDGILGEEFGHSPGSSGLTWVLDPIDGTRGYISGSPTWGVLISVADAQGPFYGIIDQPFIKERFYGGLGEAYVDGPHGRQSLQTRAISGLAQATLLTTFPEIGSAAEHRAFHDVAAQVRLTRYGMDCYGYALLALGQVDLVIEAGLYPYDIQAPIAVVEAAGGLVSNWQGGPVHQGGQVLAAANAEIHAAAMAILNKHL